MRFATSLALSLAAASQHFEAALAAGSRFRRAANPLGSFDLGCYMEDNPSALETGGAKGRSYRGLQSTTMSGRTCQRWTDTHPWKDAANIKPSADTKSEVGGKDVTDWGNGLGNHNYCRNPDSSMDQPWCYTMDPTKDHKKELCGVPKCKSTDRDFTDEATNLATKVKSKDCKCADQLYGSTKTTKDTSVALAQRAANAAGAHCDCS